MTRIRRSFTESTANRRALYAFVRLHRVKVRQVAESIEGLEFRDGRIVESGRGTRTRRGRHREGV